jgi:cytochrome bd ubiquinol oxidase subunit I
VSALDLARWQFGVTTVYHFVFVPLTLGITWYVAVFQTLWFRNRDPEYLRLTRFFGKLMLINFAIGVVTGLVQEFQFGMNWSSYSRYVGDVFGAPLAMEGLIAFFLESTFLGLWIFGWGRLSPRLHLTAIWLVAIGTTLSAYFILAANSWMQHPVGYMINPTTGRAQMTSILEVLTNSTLLLAFPHTMLAAALTASMLVTGVAAWHVHRGQQTALFARALHLALPIGLVAALGVSLVGDSMARLMTEQQPMKMAAAEALYETRGHAPFSLFAVAPFEAHPTRSTFDLEIPDGLSMLATHTVGGTVQGINDINRSYQKRYGPGDYRPIIGVTYWTFRIMSGIAVACVLIMLWGVFMMWRGKLTESRRYLRLLIFATALPFIGNLTGWMFTEMGRQPWVVQGLLLTRNAVSPSVSVWQVGISLTTFTLLYGLLACVDGWLMFHFARKAPEEASADDDPYEEGNLAMAY